MDGQSRTGDGIVNSISTSTYNIVCGKQWKFCPDCGTKLGDGWKFCSDCGNPVMHSAPPMQVWPTYPIYPQPWYPGPNLTWTTSSEGTTC